MARDTSELQIIRDEMDNDPLVIGWGLLADPEAADVWNDETHATAAGTVDRLTILAGDVRAATPFDEYDALSIDEQEWLRWLTGGHGDLPVTVEIKSKLANRNASGGIWAVNDNDAPDAIKALIERPGSRREVLLGVGSTFITASDVADARRLP
jgi:hypothetical protein